MKSYLKFLSRNKLYTAIEAIGLAVSLAFVILIGSYTWQQWAVTLENPDRKDIYTFGLPNNPGLTFGFAERLKASVPEVEMTARFSPQITTFVQFEGQAEEVHTVAVDPSFFHMFPQYHFLEGSPEGLATKTDVLVSESFARSHDLSVGSHLFVNGTDCNVAGIVEDFKQTLFNACDVFVHLLSDLNVDAWNVPFDHYGSTITFAKVVHGTDRTKLKSKVEALCKELYPGMYGRSFFEYLDLDRIDEVFFKEYDARQTCFRHGDAKMLRLLLLVGLLLLLSAIFNYVNLSFALTGRRAKEMATRRLLGEDRNGIIWRQITESITFTAVCFGTGLLLAYALTPSFNSLLNNPDVPVMIHLNIGYLLIYILLIAIVGTLTGLLPAFLAGKYRPIDVVRGSFRRHTKMTFSKVFIVLQNVLAVFLVAMALVMEAQYQYSMNRPMHARTDGIYYLEIQGNLNEQTSLRDALEAIPAVQRIGFTQRTPGLLPGGQFSMTLQGEEIMYRTYRMDSTAFRIFDFEILKDYHTPLYGGVWFGKRAFAATGLSDDNLDINDLKMRTGGVDQVAGVIADFPTNSSNIGEEDYLYVNIFPREKMFYGGWLMETTGDPKDVRKAIQAVCDQWREGRQVIVLQNGFVKDFFKEALRPTKNNMRMMELFMLLAILIALLGLLAMSTYFAGERSADIAVRKVFGSTVNGELWHNVREYMLLVGVACVIGVPLAVWAAQKYLESYIYRLENYWWLFVIAVLLTLAMAFGTVLWQTLKAAKTNPATELKKE